MKKKIFLFIFFVVLGIVQAVIFMLAYRRLFESCSFAECLLSLAYAIPQSVMVSAWLMLPAFIVGVIYVFIRGSWHRMFMIWYITLALMGMLFLTCIDWILYGFWGFRIDTTPFIYIFDNPAKAIGRTPWWGFIVTFGTVFLMGWLVYGIMSLVYPKRCNGSSHVGQRLSIRHEAWGNLGLAIAMFIIGNGCFGLMGIGSAYFSDYQPLNHAATNPIYNLCHSVRQHFTPFDKQYRFMSKAECQIAMQELARPIQSRGPVLLKNDGRPNVLLIAFESFSGAASHYLYPEASSLAMPCFDKAMSEGIAFTRFYANSFRTERAFVSILSGYPGQPTFSLITDDDRTRHLDYLTRPLIESGYSTEFFYGGDGKFCHLDTYLDYAGIDRQTEKAAFPEDDFDADFGMHDAFMFDYVFNSLKKEALAAADTLAEYPAQPYFKFFSTLSSHEPFEVPMQRLSDPYLNSVAYTDSCLGAFLDKVRADHTIWDNLLIICMPDHCYSNYPEGIQQHEPLRYHIPMFWTGGVVAGHADVPIFAQQADLAVTLLHQLGIPTQPDDFPFSHDIFDPASPHFAFYAWPDGFGFLTDSCSYVQDNHFDGHPLEGSNDPSGHAERLGKAYLQTLFDHISALK
jgi:phosphoglycerol transferase MdoB-like AlkP superfamily enzyme